MEDVLRRTFAEDLDCPLDADVLAAAARRLLPGLTDSSDDSPEDLALRLRDPRYFGAFVGEILQDTAIRVESRFSLAEHAFDLLPLPRGEADIILVESRAPPRLLALAAFLAERSRLTILHVMHLLFAVFLDRTLVRSVERGIRTRLLEFIVGDPETPEPVRLLYTCLHLASVPEPEAHETLRRVLRGPGPTSLKRALASVVAASDGGVGELVSIARAEGLLPSEPGHPVSPSEVASIPRLPARLAAVGRRWLRA